MYINLKLESELIFPIHSMIPGLLKKKMKKVKTKDTENSLTFCLVRKKIVKLII